jgi:hypothetical protein
MKLEERLERLGTGTLTYPQYQEGRTTCFQLQRQTERLLGVVGDAAGLEGTLHEPSGVLLCNLTPANAAALRQLLPCLKPVPLGLRTSAGFGDRLGLATPGHIGAMQKLDQPGRIAPIFAQQSVRENARTGRSPQQVVDDATWGVLQAGWREPWGADADHLKAPAEVAPFAAAGYSMFTIDPGDHVDDTVAGAPPDQVETKLRDLPWDDLEDSLTDLESRFLDRPFDLDGSALTFDRETLWRAAVKYGGAVAHTLRMYRHIGQCLEEGTFELEVSVDETETPTSVAEHLFIAAELRRLGVQWISLAPRFVGRFEKGVDYIGDLDTFTAELAGHAAVARVFGPFKLSLHSGSDKFSIYPIAARLVRSDAAHPLVHVKTAGTSYLEALRTVAGVNPTFFREILELSRERYEIDAATYHVSARLDQVPAADSLGDDDLAGLLDQFDARQVLHVTYGSVLDCYGSRLHSLLEEHENLYHSFLAKHFERHLAPFAE